MLHKFFPPITIVIIQIPFSFSQLLCSLLLHSLPSSFQSSFLRHFGVTSYSIFIKFHPLLPQTLHQTPFTKHSQTRSLPSLQISVFWRLKTLKFAKRDLNWRNCKMGRKRGCTYYLLATLKDRSRSGIHLEEDVWHRRWVTMYFVIRFFHL